MDLRELECLVAVADTGGVGRAAQVLGITQPGVSAALRRLEREVGERLLERSGRGVRLTDAGRAALGPARAALASSAAVRTTVAELTGLLTGRVRLGHVSSGATSTLLEPLTRFHAAHPGVEVSLVEDGSGSLLDQLLDGRLDLAWVGVSGDLPAGVGARTVVDELLVLGVPGTHDLAHRGAITFDEAVTHPLIAMPSGTGARSAFDAGCAERGLVPRIAFQCSSPDLIGQLTDRGLGVAVLPDPLARALGLHVVRLTEPQVRSRLALTWASGGPSSPAARAFLELVGS